MSERVQAPILTNQQTLQDVKAWAASEEAERLRKEVQEAIGILMFFNDGCGCVAIDKDGPCPRCMARAFIARNTTNKEKECPTSR